MMIRHVAAVVVAAGIAVCAGAQTFSPQTIDTGLLPDLVPGHNACLDRDMLATHACQPVATLLRAIEPPPAGDRAVVSTADVLQLCGAHNVRDSVCGIAALLELRYHSIPCWASNKC